MAVSSHLLTHQLSRRQLLATAVGAGGLSLSSLLQLRAAAPEPASARGKAKSCILIYCWGGMSHLESWDLKPDAPVEMRGEFLPIATATPGTLVSEHLPLLARETEKLGARKGTFYFFASFFGRPRGRRDDSSPNFVEAMCVHVELTNGRLRAMLARIAATSASVCSSLTRRAQSLGRGGHGQEFAAAHSSGKGAEHQKKSAPPWLSNLDSVQ